MFIDRKKQENHKIQRIFPTSVNNGRRGYKWIIGKIQLFSSI
jgi:hypothetical protein